MGWSIGYDTRWSRDIGYGVPAHCDHPRCNAEIDRGLTHVCGEEPYGGPHGCGLFFCEQHLAYARRSRGRINVLLCERCRCNELPFEPSADHLEWVQWKLTDDSWQRWRDENPDWVAQHAHLATAAEVAADEGNGCPGEKESPCPT
ncbi:hypothetical protein [Pseudoxanthomonas sp. USHLN014]|uniref:hypothetical protein n=1 Tax=Pseudoxanthomonas sp. USHLN014 TaxID=3081297 RepID=UPI00301CE198